MDRFCPALNRARILEFPNVPTWSLDPLTWLARPCQHEFVSPDLGQPLRFKSESTEVQRGTVIFPRSHSLPCEQSRLPLHDMIWGAVEKIDFFPNFPMKKLTSHPCHLLHKSLQWVQERNIQPYYISGLLCIIRHIFCCFYLLTPSASLCLSGSGTLNGVTSGSCVVEPEAWNIQL